MVFVEELENTRRQLVILYFAFQLYWIMEPGMLPNDYIVLQQLPNSNIKRNTNLPPR